MRTPNPPFLPLHFFYFPFSSTIKRLFLGALILIAVIMGMLLATYYNPSSHNNAIEVHTYTQAQNLPVKKIEHRYIEMDLVLPVYQQWGSFEGDVLRLPSFPRYLFVILQVLGWSMALTVATNIKSKGAFAIYLIFLLDIFLANPGELILSNATFPLIEVGFLCLILGAAFIFQIRQIRIKAGYTFVASVLILSLLWGSVVWTMGTRGWLEMVANQYYILLILSMGMIWFSSKDAINLLVIAANNRPRRLARWSVTMLRVGWGIILFTLLLMVAIQYSAMRDTAGVSPLLIGFFCMFFTVFTSQNLLRPVQYLFTSHKLYTFIILSWLLITLSFLYFMFHTGDPTFIRAIERSITIFLLSTSLVYVIYIETNYLTWLREKVNIFYLLGKGTRIPFPAVMLAGLLGFVIMESVQGWKTAKLFIQSQLLLEADLAIESGDDQQAIQIYELANKWIPYSPKGNYNRGVLLANDSESKAAAIDAFEDVSTYYDMPLALLNRVRLVVEKESASDGIALLKEEWDVQKSGVEYLSHNLASYYTQMGLPDSAIKYLKQALLHQPNQSLSHSHLGRIYAEYGKNDFAKRFLQASVETADPSSSVSYTNALYYQLSGLDIWDSDQPPFELDEPQVTHEYLSINKMAYLLHLGKDSEAQKVAAFLADTAALPLATLVAGYLQIKQDSLENGFSRIEYVNLAYPNYKAIGKYMLGLAYFESGIYEMAGPAFGEAAKAGMLEGYIQAARMYGFLGKRDSAVALLTTLWSREDELGQAAQKEYALLLESAGQSVYAQVEWDMSQLSVNDRMRISLYADSTREYLWTLENFRYLLAQDSLSTAPYLEMGNIYLKYRDTLARSTYKQGWQQNQSNPLFALGLAQSFVYEGNWDSVAYYLAASALKDTASLPASYWITQAQLAFSKQDSITARTWLEVGRDYFPLHVGLITRLANVYMAKNDFVKAGQLLNSSLTYNDQNPILWLSLARLSREMEMNDSYQYALDRARQLISDAEKEEKLINRWL